MKSLIVALILTLGARAAESQTHFQNIDTSCLVLFYHTDTAAYGYPRSYWDSLFNAIYNPDSVMRDTCDPKRTGWYGIAKRGAHFYTPGLTFNWAPAGSILEVPWTQIDTFYREIRDGMKFIFDSISPFVIRKVYPEDTEYWNSQSAEVEFHFPNYISLDTIEYYLRLIQAKYPSLIASENWPPPWPIASDPRSIVARLNASESGMIVYPNPATDFVHMSLAEERASVALSDMLGREFHVPNNAGTLDVRSLPPGTYLVRVVSGGMGKTVKFIKQ